MLGFKGVRPRIGISELFVASSWVLLIFVSCTSTQPSNQLSRQGAIEIANDEVFRVTKSDLRQFGPPEASHVQETKSWSISYRRRNHTESELTVEVDERTRTAVVRMP